MPCISTAVNVNVPSGPSGPSIPGYGIPSAPAQAPFHLNNPTGFPEDLSDVYNLIELILPPGTVKPSLNLHSARDVFDGIFSLVDKFFPFLMLYKFFLPILNIIVCLIEIMCALLNPFKLSRALSRLFRQCIPEFLAIFPIFALIIMILSILNLIISLVLYIIGEVEKLVVILLRNIATISKALSNADEVTILAATNKIGMVLCSFQNLFLLLSIFTAIIDVIKEMLKVLFNLPPCDSSNNNDVQCCTPDVCPSFIKNDDGLNRTTGTFQYFNALDQDASSAIPYLPPTFSFISTARPESWQFFDSGAAIQDAFWNISNAYDLPSGSVDIFFPTDANYTASTPVSQVPYTIDFRLFYNPTQWDSSSTLGPRYIRVLSCIVLKAPTQHLTTYNNGTQFIQNGVLEVAGGLATEDDGITPLLINGTQATLNNLIHLQPTVFITNQTSSEPVVYNDGYQFANVDYTFHINYPVLLQKALITLGCFPIVALNRTFVNTIYGGNSGANAAMLNNLLANTGTEGSVFPDVAAAQQCLTTALSALQNNVNAQSVAAFQALTTACLTKLSNDAATAINTLVGIGYDPYTSTFTINPSVQFTTLPIVITVNLFETSGQSITSNMAAGAASTIASNITAVASFGVVSSFTYDGVQTFTANLTSPSAGSGTLQIYYDNKVISTVTLPADTTVAPTLAATEVPYSFIYSTTAQGSVRRDEGDIARDADAA
jgi:hypothetical protein